MNTLSKSKNKNNRKIVEHFMGISFSGFIFIGIICAIIWACVNKVDCSFLMFWEKNYNY